MLRGERSVEADLHQADLQTLFHQFVDGLFDGLCHGTHGNDHVFGLGVSVIIEGLIFSAGQFSDLFHVVFHDIGNLIVEFIGCFSSLEENIRVLGRAPCDRVFRRQCIVPESLYCVPVHDLCQVFVFNGLDLLDLVGGPETIKEVKERYSGFDGCHVCHTGQVHNLLYRTGSQHGKSGLTSGHDVGMVAENVQCMSGNRSRTDVHNAREQFPGDLVHIRDH